jgi:hypothetical protein
MEGVGKAPTPSITVGLSPRLRNFQQSQKKSGNQPKD